MKNQFIRLRGALPLALMTVLAMLLFNQTASAQTPLLPARVVHAAKARVAAGEYPALVIGVVDGAHSHVYTFGKLADGKAPNKNTVFEIGSVTKTFTATMLAEEVLGGKDKLNEPVAKLLPGFSVPSRDGKYITLDNLAEQHSALPRNPTNLDPTDPHNPFADYDAKKLKAFLASYKLTRDPGSKYEYSNLGVGLLGYALARQNGMTYGALAEKKILKPLGMHLSGAKITPAMRKHLAAGHNAQGKPAENFSMKALAGAGVIKSTGADMLRYLKANMGITKTPLDGAMRFAHKPRMPAFGNEKIGLVWMTRPDKDGDVVWHNGETGGYTSFLGFTADGKHGVVILTNIQQSVDDLGFATLLADAKLAPTEAATHLSKQALNQYVGNYRLAPHFIVSAFRKGDQLYAEATGQAPFPIFPSARDEFFAKIANIQISFKRGKQGTVNGLVLHQNGDHDAPRISSSVAERSTYGKPPLNLPVSTLKEYVGHYRFESGGQVVITLKGEQLYAQGTDESAFAIYPSKKDVFHPVINSKLTFKRGKNGKVDALVLRYLGRSQRASRVSH